MPQSRGTVVLVVAFALIGAVATGTGGAALATTAGRALDPVDTIMIVSASTAPVPGGVQLSVTANSTTPIVTMNAHLLDATTSSDVLDLAMAQSATGPDPGDSTWTVTLTVGTPPTGLPIGTYDITVDAVDQGGTTLPAGPTVATLPFVNVPAITPNAVHTVISYDNQTPAISGTVTETAPGAGSTPVPYAGQQVVLAGPAAFGSLPLTTDKNGGYSYTLTDPMPGTYTVSVLPTSTLAAATAPPATFTVQYDPVTISASLSAKTITYGGNVTVSGTVSYEPGSTFVPLTAGTVKIYDRAGAPRPVATATVTEGHFTATLPKEAASVRWVLQAGGPYLDTQTVTLPMKVSLPTVIGGFQATLNQFWQVSYRGCVALAAGVPGYVPALSGLTIQDAAGPGGPWHTLGTVPKQKSVLCGNGGQTFSGTLTAKLNYAYYRAVYAGGTNTAGTGYLPTASGRVLAWKYEDRITSFSVSPRVLPKGRNLTVSGQLQYYLGQWRDYAGQTVYVILRPKGQQTWYYIVVATTNPAGRFSVTFADPVSATWSAEYFGNSAHLATLAPQIYVAVT
jgi:hypothetical protein